MPGSMRASRCGSLTSTAAPLAERLLPIAQLLLPMLSGANGACGSSSPASSCTSTSGFASAALPTITGCSLRSGLTLTGSSSRSALSGPNLSISFCISSSALKLAATLQLT